MVGGRRREGGGEKNKKKKKENNYLQLVNPCTHKVIKSIHMSAERIPVLK